MFARYYHQNCAAISFAVILAGSSFLYADKKVSGDMTVEGNTILEGALDVLQGMTVKGDTDLMGNIFSIGHSLNSNGSQNYAEAGLEVFIKNTSATTRLVEQVTSLNKTTFKWGTKDNVDTDGNGILDDFGAQWMSLSKSALHVKGDLLVKGSDNQLTEQTITGANSILTKGLADALYLTPVTASALYLNQASADASYLRRSSPQFVFGTDAMATGDGSIAFGVGAFANFEAPPVGFEGLMGAATALGWGSYANGRGATAIGSGAWASESCALSLGTNAGAGAENSVSIGVYANSFGPSSIAIGESSSAQGANAVALGVANTVQEENGVVIGYASCSMAPDQIVLGSYNKHADFSYGNMRLPDDDIFIVANGTSEEPSNAFTIKRNGDAEINGSISVTGVIRIIQPAGGIAMGEFVNP